MVLTKKLIKITAWLLVGFLSLYLVLLFAAGVYINNQQQRIISWVADQINTRIRGTVSIGSMNASPWSSFPSIDFRLNNVTIADSVYQKPVLRLKTLSTSFSLLQLIRGKTVVNNVSLENGELHLVTDSNGYSNSFFRKNDKKQAAQPGNAAVSIEQLRLKNISLIIENQVKHKEISFIVQSAQAGIATSDSLQQIVLNEKILMKKGLGFNLARGAYLEGQTINGKWNLVYNAQAKTIAFSEAKVSIGKQPFVLGGEFSMGGENPQFRIQFSTQQIGYPLAQQLVTARIRQKLTIVEIAKPLDASGSIQGSLLPAHEPSVDIQWQTSNNRLNTEAGEFDHCSFAGSFTNHLGPGAYADSNSRISFTGISAAWNGITFTADTAKITNLDTARLQVHVISSCQLKDVDTKLGMEDIAFTGGEGQFDLVYDGPLVRDKSMLQGLTGSLVIKDGSMNYTPRGFNFTQCNGKLLLLKDSMRMNDFNCRYGSNQFSVSLYASNISQKLTIGNAATPAVFDCFVRSPFINLDDFSSLFGQTKQRSSAKKASGSFAATARNIDALLDNSSIGIHVKANAFKRNHLQASKLEANVRFEPRHWELEKIAMNVAGGSIACNGKVLHGASNTHTAQFNIKVINTDISQLLFGFDNFGQEALTHREISGRFSTDANLQAGINGQGRIVPASLKGEVNFSLKEAALQNYEPLNRLKTFVFKNRDLRNVRFAELKDKLGIDGEQIKLDRMEIQSSAFRLFLEGNYGLAKRNTDLLIQVPFSNLNGNSFENEEGPVNKGVRSKTGASIWLRAVNDEDGKVKLKLTMRKKLKT